MPRKSSITFAESAVADFEDIMQWYVNQEAPHIGQKLVTEILTDIEQPALYPDMGRVAPEFGQSNLRELIRNPFRIVYRHDAAKVRIVRIWRSERLLLLP
jgi:toxin ParE1/3/4